MAIYKCKSDQPGELADDGINGAVRRDFSAKKG
jgi:hypothetical protein